MPECQFPAIVPERKARDGTNNLGMTKARIQIQICLAQESSFLTTKHYHLPLGQVMNGPGGKDRGLAEIQAAGSQGSSGCSESLSTSVPAESAPGRR